MTAKEIIDSYISFFEKRGHKRIENAPLVLQNDPTTLFTSSGMQPLVPYLLGEQHPQGKRLVNVQNCFRAQDIDEIGDNRHTTFFRMIGNWSFGDYFKKKQLPWFFEFLTEELQLDPHRLYVTVFKGYKNIPKDKEAAAIWTELFKSKNVNPEGRIFYYGTQENWWSRAGVPENMPNDEPGGPDSEVFFDFYPQQEPIGEDLKMYSHNGRLLEIGNSVFMEYKKQGNDFIELPHKNVDFGGGLERLLAAAQNQQDIFQTSLFSSIIHVIEQTTNCLYQDQKESMRIIADHLTASVFICSNTVTPSNKEQGYILRRLIRRGLDNLHQLNGKEITPIIETIVEQYKNTDRYLVDSYAQIKNTILEEEQKYTKTRTQAKKFIQKKYNTTGDELMGSTEISIEDAFALYTTHGLSPTQITSLGYSFDKKSFAQKMKQHQDISRKGATKKFAGGLEDHKEKTIMGHTATHLLHQALRDVLGSHVHQTGSNITNERVRFDFNCEDTLTEEQIQKVDTIVNNKIGENLQVHFEMISTEKAKRIGAIGLFDTTYGDVSKIYFIGGSSMQPKNAYSIEFCGGPHVNFTGEIKSFKIIKQENLGNKQKRLYAVVGT